MTATREQIARFEANCASHRPGWESTRPEQQARFLAANAVQVAEVEAALIDYATQPERIECFAALLDAYETTSQRPDGPSMLQAVWLAADVANAAPHLLADLRRALVLLAEAHAHYVSGVRDANRHIAHEYTLEAENTRLLVLVDQLRAEKLTALLTTRDEVSA
jgi:hypothetical protein